MPDLADERPTPEPRRPTDPARLRTDDMPALKEPPTTTRERQLFDTVKRQTDQLLAINNVITAAAHSPNLHQTLETAMEAALTVLPLEAAGISLIDREANELVLYAQRGWRYDFTSQPMRIKIGASISGTVVRTGEVLVTGDVSQDERLYVPAFVQEGIKAMALVPMRARGRVIGVLSVMSRAQYQFSKSEVSVLQVIADQVGLALDNALLVDSIRAQQGRIEAILHATADAIIATDENGIINLVNQAAESLFGLRTEEILKTPLREAVFLPQIKERLAMAMRHSSTERMFEVGFGPNQHMLCEVSPVPIALGLGQKGGCWVVVFRDISHLKQAEQTRLQFIQTAAHELRNPLGVTLSALNMLWRGREQTATASEKEVYEIAHRGINRMQDLIDDLLSLEKVESGIDFRFEPVDIREMVERIAADMRPMLERKNQQLAVALSPDLPLFNGDEGWLYRAVVNLVSNAHKYTQEGSQITIRANARPTPNGLELLLQVEDNGPGIPQEAQRRLFERFYRVRHHEQKAMGTGLGLAIVKSVAEKHGGRVGVYSELPLFSTLWRNKGATFSMIMPYRSQPPTPNSDESANPAF